MRVEIQNIKVLPLLLLAGGIKGPLEKEWGK
jgi:hypothetical protein